MRSDGGGEFINGKLQQFCHDNGIRVQQSAPYSPQQNGVAERKNRYLVEMMRCMLAESKLEKKFWGEAIATANYIQNRLPTSSSSKTPYELYHEKKPSYTHFRIFGSTAYVHIPKQKRRKLDKKAEKLTFVGYAEGCKAYRFLNRVDCSITISRDAKFDETFNEEPEVIEHVDDDVVVILKNDNPIPDIVEVEPEQTKPIVNDDEAEHPEELQDDEPEGEPNCDATTPSRSSRPNKVFPRNGTSGYLQLQNVRRSQRILLQQCQVTIRRNGSWPWRKKLNPSKITKRGS